MVTHDPVAASYADRVIFLADGHVVSELYQPTAETVLDTWTLDSRTGCCKATLKSLLSRKLRLVLSGLAVVLGVMFVSGAFVLTDTLGRSFDGLFATIYSGTDVQVSAKPKVDVDEFDGETVPANIPAAVVDRVRAVPGVAKATGSANADGARVIGRNGKVVTTFGPPRLGENWTGESDLRKLREGRGPSADDEIAVNAATAKAAGLHVGDQVGVLTLQPKKTFTLVGIFGYSGDRDSLGGALEVAFTEPVAQQLMLGQTGVYSDIDVTRRRASRRRSCATTSPPRSARTTRSRPASSWPRRPPTASSRG